MVFAVVLRCGRDKSGFVMCGHSVGDGIRQSTTQMVEDEGFRVDEFCFTDSIDLQGYFTVASVKLNVAFH